MRLAHEAQVIPVMGSSMRSCGCGGGHVYVDVVAGLVDRIADGGVVDAGSGDGHDLAVEVDVDGVDAGDLRDLAGDRRAAVAAGDTGDGVGGGLHVGRVLSGRRPDQETVWVKATV